MKYRIIILGILSVLCCSPAYARTGLADRLESMMTGGDTVSETVDQVFGTWDLDAMGTDVSHMQNMSFAGSYLSVEENGYELVLQGETSEKGKWEASQQQKDTYLLYPSDEEQNVVYSGEIITNEDDGAESLIVYFAGYILRFHKNDQEDMKPAKVSVGSSDTKSSDYLAVTMGEKNALEAAANYLAVMPFSRSGLVEQLTFEGYSDSEAEYAVNNCGADWNEQAEKSAKKYQSLMSFSKEEMIEQLEYEGFTHEQAVYGADKAE